MKRCRFDRLGENNCVGKGQVCDCVYNETDEEFKAWSEWSNAKHNSPGFIPDIEPHYNRGLGMEITSRSQYRSELKRRGLVEIGNEKKYVDPVRQRQEKERQNEKAIEALRPEAHRMLDHIGSPRWN